MNVSASGFAPDFLIVEKGTTVVWTVEDDGSYWPASNFHPTHVAYPGSGIEKCGTVDESHILDACRGLKIGDSYNFTFDKVGRWGIHDHLHPAYTMSIEVADYSPQPLQTSPNMTKKDIFEKVLPFLKISKIKTAVIYKIPKISAKEQSEISKTRCDNESNWGVSTHKTDCYVKQMEQISFKYGRDFAYDTLFELQKIDPVARVCHFIAHGIGWGMYQSNPAAWQKLIAESRNECTYGEQMGVIERYTTTLSKGKLTKEDVPSLCGPNPKANCNHAVGHMMLLETKNSISEATDLCQSLAGRGQKLYCITGVFMERIAAVGLLEHGLVPKNYTYNTMGERINESEALCRSYNESYNDIEAAGCWQELSHAAAQYFNNDPKKVFDFCNTAQTKEAASMCKMHSLFNFLALNRFNLTKVRYVCTLQRKIDSNFEERCYNTFVKTSINYVGSKAALKAAPGITNYCLSLRGKFSKSCFVTVGIALKEIGVGTNDATKFCQNVPKNYTELCTGRSADKSNFQVTAQDITETAAQGGPD